MKHKIVDNL